MIRSHLVAVLSIALATTLPAQSHRQHNSAISSALAVPAWLFPLPSSPGPRPDSVVPLSVPGSAMRYTAAQIANQYGPPDWHPETHPKPPAIVTNGRPNAVIACAFCHLPDGRGRPENATLGGLPADYIVRQVEAIKAGTRRPALQKPFRPFELMHVIADSVAPDELRAAAAYFSKLELTRRSRVLERASIPRVVPSLGLYVKSDSSGAGTEPLGHRLIEIPDDAERHERRDAMTPYVTYVPRGSVARGRALATSITRKTPRPCTSCHGPNLRGVAPAPPIAGRSPSYVLRQLLAFRNRMRVTDSAAMMRDVTSRLTLDDMIAVAAYVGSRKP